MKNEDARVEELRRDGWAGEAEARVLNRASPTGASPTVGALAVAEELDARRVEELRRDG